MHQIQCTCPKVLAASWSRIYLFQQRRAVAVVFPHNRAASSLSSPSSEVADNNSSSERSRSGSSSRRPPSKSRDVCINLDKDFSFFTRKEPQLKEASSSRIQSVVTFCDEAIILSRKSSDPRSFRRVQELMNSAAEHFFTKVEQAKRWSKAFPDLSYDVYLLRSSWLQVVRTILALVGKDAAEVCSHMMCDYLKWEQLLGQSKLQLKDGTEQLPSPQARQQGGSKMQEERFFHGPFVQDSAVVLYDLFWHLTISDEDAKVKPFYVRSKRTYLDEAGPRRSLLAHKLWNRVIRIPITSWGKPMSITWRPYPYNGTKYKSSRRLLTASMLFQGQALIRSKRLMDCIELWKSGMKLCDDGQESHSTLLLGRILNCLRQTQQHIRHGNIPDRYAVSAKDYFVSLYALLNLLIKIQWPKEHKFGDKDIFANYDAIMQHLLAVGKTQRMLIERGIIDSQTEKDVDYYVGKIESVLHSLIKSWSITKWYRPPPFRYVKTCNSILYSLVVGTAHQRPAADVALEFLRVMIDGQCNLPLPDRNTSTILIRAGQESGNAKIAMAVIQALHGTLSQDAGEVQGDSVVPDAGVTKPDILPSTRSKSTLLVLAEDAMLAADVDRMVSLLERPAGNVSQRKRFRAALCSIYDASIRQIVFFLYPYLDLTRKRRLRYGIYNVNSGRTAAMDQVAYNPRVLIAVLQLIVDQGKTGLAERVWRLIKRASKTKSIRQQSAGWPIPIRAYTIMMNLYASEVRSGTVKSYRSVVSRSKSASAQRRSGSDVHGWGRVRLGPLRNRLPFDIRLNRASTARFIVKQEYLELKERWKTGSAEAANDQFWKAIERVFRRKGRSSGQVQLSNEADSAFYNDLVKDMT